MSLAQINLRIHLFYCIYTFHSLDYYFVYFYMKLLCKLIVSFIFCCGSLGLKTQSARGRYIEFWSGRVKKIFFLIVIAICLSSPVFCASEKQLFESGLELLKQDKYQEAVDAFTILIDMAPENPHAYRNRGVAHMKLNQYDLAIDDFERTKEIVPELKGLHSNIGVAWYYKKNYSKAIENYDREILLSPDNYFAYFNRAICLAVLEDYEKSFSDITRTIELLPQFYLAFCLKGDLLVKMEQPEKAKLAYEKAISIDQDQTYAKEQLAGLKIKSGSMAKLEPVKVPVTDKKYELQVGAFQVRNNAIAMQKKLEKKGYKATLLELTRPNEMIWFLVRVGSYSRQKESEADKKMLKNDFGIDAIVKPSGKF